MWVIYGDPFPGGGDACEITGVASLGPPSWPLGSSWPFLAPRAWRSQEEPEGARRSQEEGPIGHRGPRGSKGHWRLSTGGACFAPSEFPQRHVRTLMSTSVRSPPWCSCRRDGIREILMFLDVPQ